MTDEASKKLPNLVLFAASRDQRRYFSELAKHTHLGTRVKWYKSLRLPSLFTSFPGAELWRQAEFLTIRKRHSRKGKHYPKLFWPLFTALSWLQACWIYAQYAYWLEREQAQFIGVWNGKKFRQAILLEALERFGRQPVFFETGPLPGVSAIDPKGVNAYSSIPREAGFYRDYTQPYTDLNAEKTEQACSVRPKDLPEHYIFVPFQVVEDSNIYLHSPWIRSMRQLFAICQRMSEQLGDNTVFVFKPHPACDEDYSDLRALQTAQLRFVEDIPTPQLVQHADAVVTVNSTVGLEGLMAGKKVLVLGDALFAIEGISYPITDEAMLLDHLQKLEQLPFDADLTARFIGYLQNDYAVPGNAMQSPDAVHWAAVEQKLRWILQYRNDLALGLSEQA